MLKEIVLPELAESVVEGEIQRWLVAVGDRVAKDQPIVEVMTDKATVELPSPMAGVVQKLLAREGQVVPVHTPIALILVAGEDETAGPESHAAPDASLFKPSEHEETIKNPFLTPRGRTTPIARRTAFPAPPAYRSPPGYETREERIPLAGVRRAIAKQMALSHLHTVRTLVVDEADWSALGAIRGEYSYLPFVLRAVARALVRFPALNSSLDERAQEIVLKRYYNLGVAVNTEAGLVVPVIRDVDTKTVPVLAGEIESIARRAREGGLTPAELEGSTFTVSSIGNVGTLFSFPIINVPDAAILGVHTIQRRPVVVEEGGREQVVVRDMVYLSLSFDHRLVDGHAAASFLRELIDLLEHPHQL